jgi:hypothetical protein
MDNASQLSSIKGESLMSNYYSLTPEAKIRRKKRNKYILYASLLFTSVVLSAVITVLINEI